MSIKLPSTKIAKYKNRTAQKLQCQMFAKAEIVGSKSRHDQKLPSTEVVKSKNRQVEKSLNQQLKNLPKVQSTK